MRREPAVPPDARPGTWNRHEAAAIGGGGGRGPAVHRLTPLARRTATDPPRRREWEAYILRCTHLLPHHKHVALTIAAHADYTTGRIPAGAPTGEAGRITQLARARDGAEDGGGQAGT